MIMSSLGSNLSLLSFASTSCDKKHHLSVFWFFQLKAFQDVIVFRISCTSLQKVVQKDYPNDIWGFLNWFGQASLKSSVPHYIKVIFVYDCATRTDIKLIRQSWFNVEIHFSCHILLDSPGFYMFNGATCTSTSWQFVLRCCWAVPQNYIFAR